MKFTIFVLLLMALPATAHPPRDVQFAYEAETGILSIEIPHDVKDASKHYINKVEVALNGINIIEQRFKRQVDNEKQQGLYKVIDAKEGDKIVVEAYCNISGKKKVQLEITTPKSSEGGQ